MSAVIDFGTFKLVHHSDRGDDVLVLSIPYFAFDQPVSPRVANGVKLLLPRHVWDAFVDLARASEEANTMVRDWHNARSDDPHQSTEAAQVVMRGLRKIAKRVRLSE